MYTCQYITECINTSMYYVHRLYSLFLYDPARPQCRQLLYIVHHDTMLLPMCSQVYEPTTCFSLRVFVHSQLNKQMTLKSEHVLAACEYSLPAVLEGSGSPVLWLVEFTEVYTATTTPSQCGMPAHHQELFVTTLSANYARVK